jgi:hypothetical protein
MQGHFRVNGPNVINEVIDGEAVIINLASGDYFSLRGSGSYIWQAIDAGADVGAIVGAFTAAGLGDEVAIGGAVEGLVAQLVAEDLIVASDGSGSSPSLAPPDGDTFEAPALEKFTDMQDLILLDPVHEVDERGWPHTTTQH